LRLSDPARHGKRGPGGGDHATGAIGRVAAVAYEAFGSISEKMGARQYSDSQIDMVDSLAVGDAMHVERQEATKRSLVRRESVGIGEAGDEGGDKESPGGHGGWGIEPADDFNLNSRRRNPGSFSAVT
jgi:hypothetical protein